MASCHDASSLFSLILTSRFSVLTLVRAILRVVLFDDGRRGAECIVHAICDAEVRGDDEATQRTSLQEGKFAMEQR